MGTPSQYDPAMSMRKARDLYFERNGFGPNGGYDEAWVDFKLGPVPMPFPNTAARKRAVPYHDLHHIVTGYATDIVGELEISAWELGAGCKDFYVPWKLNLAGLSTGVLVAPRRMWRAFVRGRRSKSLYGEPLEQLLEQSVDEVRRRVGGEGAGVERGRASDALLFALALAFGGVVAWITFASFVALAPFGLLAGLLRRRTAPSEVVG